MKLNSELKQCVFHQIKLLIYEKQFYFGMNKPFEGLAITVVLTPNTCLHLVISGVPK